jgi:NitT/TauT family transport system ATP-binding protein
VDGTLQRQASMAELADSLNFEIDDLFPMAETCNCCALPNCAGRTAAHAAARAMPRPMWTAQGDVRRGLLAHVPLAQHIRRILDERASHKAPPAVSATSWKTT